MKRLRGCERPSVASIAFSAAVAVLGAAAIITAADPATAAQSDVTANTGASEDAASAREFVHVMGDEVIAVLGDKNLTSKDKISRVEKIAHENFDFTTISRLVLARNWSKLSPEQQAEFSRLFERHLSITYGRNFDQYSGQQIKILGDRPEARGDWTVLSSVGKGDGEDFLVDYRLRKVGSSWRVIDVVVERVSLVANFRSQFQELIANRGVDKTIALLREKNAAGQTILPPKEKDKSTSGAS